jgi:hypothetical protein
VAIAANPASNGGHLGPEAIERLLNLLVAERQSMRERNAPFEALEVNRKALVHWQRELAEARRLASRK